MSPERARELYGFDALELLVMSRPLADVARLLAADDTRATVPPPYRAQ